MTHGNVSSYHISCTYLSRWRKCTIVYTLELTSLLPVHILLNSRWYV